MARNNYKKISLIVMTYNRKYLVIKCLNSLFNQSYPKNKYEIIVVDDASNDRTGRLIKNLQKKHINLRYVKHNKNRGVAATRNAGIKNAKYELIGFVADDYIMPNNYLKTVNNIFNKNNKLNAVHFNIKNYNNDFFAKINQLQSEFGMRDLLVFKKKGIVKTNCFSVSRGAVIKKTVFKKIGLFDESFRTGEDLDFGYRMLKKDINIYYYPGLLIKHVHQNKFKPLFIHRFKYGQGMYKFKKKHRLLRNFETIRLYTGLLVDLFSFSEYLKSIKKVFIYLPFFFLENLSFRFGFSYQTLISQIKSNN